MLRHAVRVRRPPIDTARHDDAGHRHYGSRYVYQGYYDVCHHYCYIDCG